MIKFIKSSDAAYSALARLQAGGAGSAMRAIHDIAASHAQSSGEACARCADWRRVGDLCEAWLRGSDAEDARIVALYVRDLESYIEASMRGEVD